MNRQRDRRRFIKTGLAVPVLGIMPWTIPFTSANPHRGSLLPDNIYQSLLNTYGGLANNITHTERLKILAADIAENGAVVPITVSGDKNLVSSVSLFIAEHPEPLASKFRFHEGADLKMSVRLKIEKTSDVIVVAETSDGLIATAKKVKVTIGCGGG